MSIVEHHNDSIVQSFVRSIVRVRNRCVVQSFAGQKIGDAIVRVPYRSGVARSDYAAASALVTIFASAFVRALAK